MTTRLARRGTAIALGGIAAIGLLAAHAIDYLLVVRDPSVRAHLLAQTGHGYLPRFLTAALIGVVIGALFMFGLGWAREHAGAARPSFRALWLRLAAVQAGAFVALELIERVHAGIPVHHMVGATMPAGVLCQLVTAALGALLLLLLHRAGELAARIFGRRAALPPAQSTWRPARSWPIVVTDRAIVASPRAPPALPS